jgi:hypothetical protein
MQSTTAKQKRVVALICVAMKEEWFVFYRAGAGGGYFGYALSGVLLDEEKVVVVFGRERGGCLINSRFQEETVNLEVSYDPKSESQRPNLDSNSHT